MKAYFYDYDTLVTAIRFTGDNADEVIAFGTQPKGSRPKVWPSPWPNMRGEPEDALSYVVDDVSCTFAPLRSGDWLVISQDGTMHACPDDEFKRRYSRDRAEREQAAQL